MQPVIELNSAKLKSTVMANLSAMALLGGMIVVSGRAQLDLPPPGRMGDEIAEGLIIEDAMRRTEELRVKIRQVVSGVTVREA